MRQAKSASRHAVSPLLRVWAAFVLAVYLLPCPALAVDLFLPPHSGAENVSSPHAGDVCCQEKGGVLHNDACCQHAVVAHSGTPQLSQQGFHARSTAFLAPSVTAMLGLLPRVATHPLAGQNLPWPLPIKPIPPNLRLLI